MMNKVLGIITSEMTSLGIDYYYMTNDSAKVTYPYFTGEYFESGYSSENAMTSGQLLIEGWMRGSYYNLIAEAEKIKAHCDALQIVTDGVAIATEFSSMSSLRTDDPELKKIEINIDIVYWKGK